MIEEGYSSELNLAPYGTHPEDTRGRKNPIREDPYRNPFQRDRDRIIHSKAFRRLEYKTQVFVNHVGDHYRTRLTHSIEVSQIARTIARAVSANQDLVEAVALGHDLGHTPFGHSGEDTLDELLTDGFRHWEQGVRVVEEVEDQFAYKGHRGLNLTWEVREGIYKHTSWRQSLRKDVYPYLEPEKPPTIEGQIVAYADQIAFISHDIDDGLRSGLISGEGLSKLQIYEKLKDEGNKPWYRKIIPLLVSDIIEETRAELEKGNFDSVEDIRDRKDFVVKFSPEAIELKEELWDYLMENLYRSQNVMSLRKEGQKVVRKLYEKYMESPELLPESLGEMIEETESAKEDLIRDYIAGMTDRFAFQTYQELFPEGPTLDWNFKT